MKKLGICLVLIFFVIGMSCSNVSLEGTSWIQPGCVLKFESNTKVKIFIQYIPGDSPDVEEATYTVSGKKITIKTEKGETLKGIVSENKLTFPEKFMTSETFTKQ